MGLLDDAYKPPGFYGGLPALLAGQDTLTPAALSVVLAAFAALALAGAWRLGSLLGGDRAALGAVIATALLPGIAGRAVIVGVEPLHVGLVLWMLVALLELRTGGRRPALLLAGVVAAGMLTKWTFAIPVAAAVGTAMVLAVRDGNGRARRILGATVTGLLPFVAWMMVAGGFDAIVGGASAEPSTTALLGVRPALYYLHWLSLRGLQIGGTILLVWALTTERGRDLRWLLWVPFGLLVVHQFIPHKEARYLVPGLGPIAVLIGVVAAERVRASRVAALGLGVLAVGLVLACWRPPPLETDLRLRPDPDDRGLAAAVVAADLPPGAVVLPVLESERWAETRDMLTWELYSRAGVVLLPARRQLSGLLPLAETEFVLTDVLRDADHVVLRDAGFGVRAELSIDAPGATALQLWGRGRPE